MASVSVYTPETDHVSNDIPVTVGLWREVSVETKLPVRPSKLGVYVRCFSNQDTGQMLVDGARFEVLEP
jgi:hypothetical protein